MADRDRPPEPGAYDRDDKLQKFSIGWDEAIAKGWTVVSMQKDWKTIFPPAKN